MLFNSYTFMFIFLPVVWMIYFFLNKYYNIKSAKIWLVLASLYFYSYFHKVYLLLISVSILFNYIIGCCILKENKFKSKFLLILGIVFNIGILGYFKYYDFFINNINFLFKTKIELLHIVLPLGISFFTFQQLSFLVDMYKKSEVIYDFLDYCLFVTFFPQLIAGPIVLPTEMLPQFEERNKKRINWENMNKGLYIFAIGLAKKVVLADTISIFVNVGYKEINNLNLIEAWITSFSYTLQLYYDFSGYCDMAVGVALMFNISLPFNFNSPYRATNIQEFWRRWHITLGRFMTNYLYIPLGGNRNGEIRTLRNLIIVFLASGIWHGAGWNFIIWGLLHGFSILIHRLWKIKGYKLNPIFGWLITFNIVNIFWIFFRSNSLIIAIKLIKKMFDINDLLYLMNHIDQLGELTKKYRDLCSVEFGSMFEIMILCISSIFIFTRKNSNDKIQDYKIGKFKNLETVVYILAGILLTNRVSEFLYFNF